MSDVILCWVKWCVKWSDTVLSEVIFCWVKWCVEWNYIVSVEVMCWVRWCVEWSDMLSEKILLSEVVCWVKCCVKWCVKWHVEWSDIVLSQVMCWVKSYCWVKWWVEWSVVLCEVVCNEVLCWVKSYFFGWSDVVLNEVIFLFTFQIIFFLFSRTFPFPSFLSYSTISLPTHCKCRVFLLHLITLSVSVAPDHKQCFCCTWSHSDTPNSV